VLTVGSKTIAQSRNKESSHAMLWRRMHTMIVFMLLNGDVDSLHVELLSVGFIYIIKVDFKIILRTHQEF
jgi:O-antigen ligase